jgi:hypothetical protein
MKNFKYKATFTASTTLAKETKKSFEAKASIDELEGLKAIMPESKDDEDILYCSFNLAVAGLINANGHGMLPETALKMMDSFKMKPMNIEHYRQDVVGAITNVGCSSFPDNKMMSPEDCASSKSPFNLCASAIVWKHVSPYFAEYLKDTNDENSWVYKDISTSWEVGFDEFVIARGSRNLFDAEIITDEKEVKRLSKYLTQMGGTGFDDTNKEVYMVISGSPRGLGGGFTSNPAAAVKGVIVHDPCDVEDNEDETDMEEDDKKCKSSENKENNISQKTKLTVKRVNMKCKNIDELIDSIQVAASKQEIVASSAIREFIEQEIMKGAEGWKSEISVRDEKLQANETKIKDLQAAVDVAKESGAEMKATVEQLTKELEEIRKNAQEAQAQQVFDSRMSELEDKYDLSDKVRKVVSNSIRNKSEEEYAEWLSNEGEVILAGKEKKVAPVEDAVLEVKASAEIIPNASSNEENKETKLSASVKRGKDNVFVITLK